MALKVEKGSASGNFRCVGVYTDAEIPESEALFDQEVTRFLADLGRNMSQDARSWKQSVPLYAEVDVD